ncbi:hypothetical protein MVEN_01952700 [Mycena venus]|uniref:Uncharacterized protein n=1 Tax=Mycena venus TaxID=2733690 RepID=A0A8H6XF77_9AGAR|nr:hypothetical protein MVEN_01952700 [Mycena venus]
MTTWYGHNPLALRSDGVLLVMRRQQTAESSWLHATTGDSTPWSRRHPELTAGTLTRNERCKLAKRQNKPQTNRSESNSRNSAPTTSPRAPDLNPDSSDAPSPVHSYLGRSPPPVATGLNTHKAALGPSAPLSEVLAYYRARRPGLWPHGVCLADGRWPDESSAVGEDPMINDVLSVRFIEFIIPEREETTIQRSRFREQLLTGLSVMSLFGRFMMRGNWRGGSLALEAMAYPPMGRRFARFTNSRPLGETFRENRLSQDPLGQQFYEELRNSHSVLSWPESDITPWMRLHHGPVRRGVVTTYPQFPAGAAVATEAMDTTEDQPMVPVAEEPESGEIEGSLEDELPGAMDTDSNNEAGDEEAPSSVTLNEGAPAPK